MDDLDLFDPSLFGVWDSKRDYHGALAPPDETVDAVRFEDVRLVLLEIKSIGEMVSPVEDLRRLLNDMTVEMRAQFATFRALRESAGEALADGDEAAQKLARADVKAATDAMSLIVRTLEKVDSLQRQLARDRDLEAERLADEGGYKEAKARFISLIEERAHDRAAELFETWKRTGPPDGVPYRTPACALETDGSERAKPADATAGNGGDSRQDVDGLSAEEFRSREDR